MQARGSRDPRDIRAVVDIDWNPDGAHQFGGALGIFPSPGAFHAKLQRRGAAPLDSTGDGDEVPPRQKRGIDDGDETNVSHAEELQCRSEGSEAPPPLTTTHP